MSKISSRLTPLINFISKHKFNWFPASGLCLLSQTFFEWGEDNSMTSAVRRNENLDHDLSESPRVVLVFTYVLISYEVNKSPASFINHDSLWRFSCEKVNQQFISLQSHSVN